MSSQTSGQIALNQSGGGANSGPNAQISYLLGPITERDKKTSDKEFGIQGSAFTTESFLPGKLFFKDEFEGAIFYRYNAYQEEIEIAKVNVPGAPVQILNRDKSISIKSITGNSIEFKTYIDKKKRTQNGYLTRLFDGEYTLFKRSDIKYTQGQKAQNSFIKAIPARFTKFTEYYIYKKGGNQINELLPKNGKLLKVLDDSKKTALKNFIKEEKLNIKNEADLIKAFEFLNK